MKGEEVRRTQVRATIGGSFYYLGRLTKYGDVQLLAKRL